MLDFTGCKLGGLHFGSNVNAAFTIDLQHPLRTFAIESIDPQVGDGLNASYDNSMTCPLYDSQQLSYSTIVKHLGKLGPGDPANVLQVTLDIAAAGETHNPTSQVYCFAYRDPSGVWHAEGNSFERTYDAATDTLHLAIPVSKGPIDALYLVTTDASSAMTRITYTVAP